ncbi:LOW QUALITY PROTEIN: hypothetical protein KUTeg_002285 [Tegillarca granosa]|uniref:Methyltransferase domain-containing protein n=1 Tax=Tegillarca granosa TaxID=220873 RepID=A0ABQ9FYB9_TEGGR|nr:LOW QUALITY PROTEIN: hypothetical protein KUTeg_002285 [Tegillarca granosa]
MFVLLTFLILKTYIINNDFSFDDAISKKYGCTVHCFDPSMRRKDFKRSEKIFFHNTGLSNKNSTKGWKMLTLMSMRRELGHVSSPIDVLKIDIEQWEHATVPEMVASGGMKGIKQFAIEIHIDLGHIGQKRDPSLQKYIIVLKFLKDLYDAGFRIVHHHCNPTCVFKFKESGIKGCSCHEVSFVNINLLVSLILLFCYICIYTKVHQAQKKNCDKEPVEKQLTLESFQSFMSDYKIEQETLIRVTVQSAILPLVDKFSYIQSKMDENSKHIEVNSLRIKEVEDDLMVVKSEAEELHKSMTFGLEKIIDIETHKSKEWDINRELKDRLEDT